MVAAWWETLVLRSSPLRATALCLSLCVACSGASGASPDGPDSGTGGGNPSTGDDTATTGDGSTPATDDAGGPTKGGSDAAASDTGTPGAGDAASDDAGPTNGGDDGGPTTLDPSLPPGGNFDLSLWELQLPVGSPGMPTTILPAQLAGAKGYSDAYFFTDTTDGSMSFWDPENGVTTANSNYPRSELREMTAGGAAANWSTTGTHTLSATVKATQIPDHVAVGQIHLGTGTPASTKPLLELFYFKDGSISLYIEQSPAGGNEKPNPAGNVSLGTKWSYVIGLSGNT
ncbi:MAG TPA: polysaccharide lyase family 7 protein, partial [Polyangiaceae bacterium]